MGMGMEENKGLENTKVAFIGLGAMGTPMAHNIRRAGYQLTVYNRDVAKTTPFREEGCQIAKSPVEAGSQTDFVVTMLADDLAVRQVTLGDNGVFKTMPPNSIFVNMSTTSPELARELEAEGRKQQIGVVSAPVLGSTKPATDGSLTILADGDEQVFKRSEELLKTMGQTVMYLGGAGNALLMKLIANGFIQIQLAAFAELLAFGERAGLDKKQVVGLLTGGALASPWLKSKAANVLNDNYDPAFSLKLTRKDIGLVNQELRRYNVPAPVTAATEQLYALATQLGRNDEDMSVLVPLVAKLAGIK